MTLPGPINPCQHLSYLLLVNVGVIGIHRIHIYVTLAMTPPTHRTRPPGLSLYKLLSIMTKKQVQELHTSKVKHTLTKR